MAKKNEPKRAIDVTGITGSGEPFASSAISVRSGVPAPAAPTGLAVASNVALRSGTSPTSLVTLTWDAVPNVNAYDIQTATDAAFTTGVQTWLASGTSGVLELRSGVVYYARIRSQSTSGPSVWSGSISFTAAADTLAPAALTGITWAWGAAGDLIVSWNLPTDSATRIARVFIYADATKTTLYRTLEGVSSVVWTAAMNKSDSASTGDTAVYVELRPVSWGGVLGTIQTPGTQPSITAPAVPTTLVHSWTGDTGSASGDLVISWTGVPSASSYQVTLDSTVYSTTATRILYTLDQNRSDHAGTPDPVISISIRSVNGLDLVSTTALTGTATNAAPAAPSAVALIAVPGGIFVTVTNDAPPLDFLTYRYRIIQTLPSAADITVDNQSKVMQQALVNVATYQVGVKVVDVFGQTSAETLSGTSVLDLTIARLRADVIYSDSVSTSPATLKAALADDNKASGGVSYAASGAWRWIRAERPFLERYRNLTISITAVGGGNVQWYVRLSPDGSTWSYFSGPATGNTITAVADQTAAQSIVILNTTLGNSTNSKVVLPSTIEARYVELWIKNGGGTSRVDEFYPRRLVEADDMLVENLAAISANMGAITAGSLNAVTITGSTITGGVIQTATSGQRVELTSDGLKTYDSAGNVVVEATTATNGALRSGAGAITIDRTGIDIRDSLTSPIQFFDDATNDEIGRISGSGSSGYFSVFARSGVYLELGTFNGAVHTLTFDTISGGAATATFSQHLKVTKGLNIGSATGAGSGSIKMSGGLDTGGAIELNSLNSGNRNSYIDLHADDTYTDYSSRLIRDAGVNGTLHLMQRGTGGINIWSQDAGGIAFLTNGGNRMAISSAGAVAIGAATNASVRLLVYGQATTSGTYAFSAKNSSGSNLLYIEDNGMAWVNSAWSVSDAREKRNIRALIANDLAGIDDIAFMHYTRELGDINEIGVIAQDVQKLAPEFVRKGMDGVLGVNMIALLCAKVARLEQRVRTLPSAPASQR